MKVVPMNEERLVTRSLPYHGSQLAALRKALTLGHELHFTQSRELERFEVSLPEDLGKIQAGMQQQYLVLWYRAMTSSIHNQEPLAWINTPTDMFVSPRYGQNFKLARAVRDLLERPLWHFMADQGRRVRCIFCNKPLDIPSCCMLGYGPVCAKRLGLYWFTS